jgi:ribosomal-protein-alanine N-acetyltransferase
MVITPEIKTTRLLLRPFQREDAPDMYRWTSSLKCTEFLFWRPNRSLEDTKRILSRWVNKPRNFAWAISLGNEVIGEINVIKDLPCHGFEIGYILRDDTWGQGYMSEAFSAVLSFLWKQGYRYGFAETDARNLRSRRLLEKFGFQLIGTEAGRYIGKIDQKVDVVQYRLDRE